MTCEGLGFVNPYQTYVLLMPWCESFSRRVPIEMVSVLVSLKKKKY